MKKVLLVLILSLCSICMVFSKSNFELSYKDVKDGKQGSLEIGTKLTVNSSVEVGFTDTAISSTNKDVKKQITLAELDTEVTGGFFKMNPSANLYMYWKVIGNPEKLPSIYIEIARPLVNTLVTAATASTTDTLHWEASWGTNVITSKKEASSINKVKVFPRTEDVGNPGVISEFCNSVKIQLATIEPYWFKPAVTYAGDLLITIESGT